MNGNIVQKEIFSNLMTRSRVVYWDINDNTILVTPDGHRAFVMRKDEILFSIDRCTKSDVCNINLDHSKMDRLKVTNNLLRLSTGGTATRLDAEKYHVWVNTSFLKNNDGCTYFGTSPVAAINVVHEVSNKTISVILPIRVKEDDDV